MNYKFIFKLVVFFACLVLIDIMCGLCLDKIRALSFSHHIEADDYKADFMVEKVLSDVVIVGSSTASHHYIPEVMEKELNLSVYNCGIDGCFFLQQTELIYLLLQRHHPKIIIWEIGEHPLSTAVEKEYQSINRFYPFYYIQHTKEFVDGKDVYQKYRMLSQLYRHNSTLHTYVFEMLRQPSLQSLNGYIPLEARKNFPSMITSIENGKIDARRIDVLNNTIDLCRESGILLVVTSSPRYYSESILDSKDYRMLIEFLQKKDVPYVDFFSIFKTKPELFYDNDHLNDDGTRKYMDLFVPELKKIITEKGLKNKM